MKALYEKLAHKLRTQALTRGPNKGRAAAQKSWAVSANNSFLYWDGDDIVGNFHRTAVVRVTPEGVLTLNSGCFYNAPTTRQYIYDVTGHLLSSARPAGKLCTTIRIANGKRVLFYDGIRLQDGLPIDPLKPFPGFRVEKQQTKALRARFKCVYDALPMYHTVHNGLPPRVRTTYEFDTFSDIGDPEDELEDILNWLLLVTRRDSWVYGRGMVMEAAPLAVVRAKLNDLLSVKEFYTTDKFEI